MKVKQVFVLLSITTLSSFMPSVHADDTQYNPRQRRYQSAQGQPGGQVQGQPGGQAQGTPGGSAGGQSSDVRVKPQIRNQNNPKPDVYIDESSGNRYVIPWNQGDQHYGYPPQRVLDSPHEQQSAEDSQRQQEERERQQEQQEQEWRRQWEMQQRWQKEQQQEQQQEPSK